MMPFSDWKNISMSFGTYSATSVGRPMPRLTSVLSRKLPRDAAGDQLLASIVPAMPRGRSRR